MAWRVREDEDEIGCVWHVYTLEGLESSLYTE
jgi:hypothetical protein